MDRTARLDAIGDSSAAGGRAGAAHAARGRTLFHAMVGETAEAPKLACRIAGQIEQQLICGDRQSGELLGSEQSLAQAYGVGRVVMRETARVLQAHGTARTRRGPNGGLLISRPETDQVVDLALRYIVHHRPEASQVSETRALIAAVAQDIAAGGGTDAGTRLILDFLDKLAARAERTLAAPADPDRRQRPAGEAWRTRAMQVASRLLLDARAGHSEGRRLGSELDLSERYSIDRSVLRQAIRILEIDGSVASLAGRGNGLVLCEPRIAPACRLIHCLFAGHGASAEAAIQVFFHLSVRMAAIAAERAGAADVERMRATLAGLRAAGDEDYAAAVRDAEDSQFDILANPLLSFMLTAVKAFPAWRADDPYILWRNRDVHAAATANVMTAIAAGAPDKAAHAQRMKFTLLSRTMPARS